MDVFCQKCQLVLQFSQDEEQKRVIIDYIFDNLTSEMEKKSTVKKKLEPPNMTKIEELQIEKDQQTLNFKRKSNPIKVQIDNEKKIKLEEKLKKKKLREAQKKEKSDELKRLMDELKKTQTLDSSDESE